MEFVMPKVSKDTMLICLKKDNMGGIAGRIKEWSSRIFWILVAYGIYYILNHIFLSSFLFSYFTKASTVFVSAIPFQAAYRFVHPLNLSAIDNKNPNCIS